MKRNIIIFSVIILALILTACGGSGYSEDAYKKAYSDAYKAAYQEGYNKGYAEGKDDAETKNAAKLITGEYITAKDAEYGANYAFVTGLYVGYMAKEEGLKIDPSLEHAQEEIDSRAEDIENERFCKEIHDNINIVFMLYFPETVEEK